MPLRTQVNDVPGKATKSQKQLHDLNPGVDYLDPKYFLPSGVPDQTDRLELLKACERLKIPRKKWPRFEAVLPGWPAQLPGTESAAPKTVGLAVDQLVFKLPAFDLCADNHRTWKRKAAEAWRVFREKQFGLYLKKCTKIRSLTVKAGGLVPRKTMRFCGDKREAVPLERRYELAARRYCLGESWATLQKQYHGAYRLDQIRKMVTKILAALDLIPGH